MEYTREVLKIENGDNTFIVINLYHLILNDLSKVREIIESEIIDIWDPSIDYSLSEVKKDIYNVISTKSEKQKHGICAEFFMHLLLRDLGYNQKCIFSNLEENSMKKGFDGFYENTNDFWIAESKCAITKNKHNNKIKEALQDIDEKVKNTSGNDPWKNAIHHLMIRESRKLTDSLQKRILDLSKDYVNNISHDSSEFNLIPSSTLFVKNDQSDSDIKTEIEKVISSRKIKNMIILCIDNDIYDEFISYLKGE